MTTGSALLAVSRGYRLGSFDGIYRYRCRDIEVDADIDRYFGCLRGLLKSVQVLLNGVEAVVVLALLSLK